jgi:hypothetical protein
LEEPAVEDICRDERSTLSMLQTVGLVTWHVMLCFAMINLMNDFQFHTAHCAATVLMSYLYNGRETQERCVPWPQLGDCQCHAQS